ncbi:MAG: helix-turn-helix domain-containing protein [Ruminococcus sp.]|nr:helix-turn-helix domain-containing protein [Ruminococcus sp.]
MYKEKLIELRESKNIKQYNIAKILNIYKGTYNQYETEYQIIPIKHLNIICNYLNVSIDYIFSLTDKKNYTNSIDNISKIKSGNRLKEFRKEKKLTQKKIAEDLNTVHQVISKYEKGTNLIATPFLYTICSKYHISADYLLGKVDNPKYLK